MARKLLLMMLITILLYSQVIITAGVNLGLYYLFLAIFEEGDNILVPEIGYPFFDEIALSY